jgi:hypothetical protein
MVDDELIRSEAFREQERLLATSAEWIELTMTKGWAREIRGGAA